MTYLNNTLADILNVFLLHLMLIMLLIMLSMRSKLEINQLRVEIPPDMHFGTGLPPSESPRQFSVIIINVWDAPTEKGISQSIKYGDTCHSNYCLTQCTKVTRDPARRRE
mmetsp:Transcript_29623/g.53584  ORF Transcript_29623/g.53584 Transcript_29623/m.53584 type:complete len:110 (+) Transcript_29623:949-1278(+)